MVGESPDPETEISFRRLAWEEIQRAYRWPRTWFPLLLFALASWGTWDSFHDGAGDRVYGTFTLLAPVALASCYVIALGWAKGITFGLAIGRTVILGIALPIPLTVANALFFIIAWMVPANRAAYENYDRNHYYMHDFGEHLMITTIGTVVMSGAVALLVLILVTLPIIVLRAPVDVAEETRVGRVRSVRIRKVSISLIVCGLSVFLLGGILAIATRGTDRIVREFRFIWRAIQEDRASTEELVWFIGMLISAAGGAAIVCGLALFLIAPRSGRPTSEQRDRAGEGERDEP